MSEVRSIAVLRANGLGDLMFALPALDALRAAYPRARITLLGLAWHQEFFAGRPSPVDDVFVLPAIPGITAPPGTEAGDEVGRAAALLRERHFDLGIQAFGGGEHSNPFMKAIGARRTIGLRALRAIGLDSDTPYRYFQSEVMRLLELVGLAGAQPVGLMPRVTVTAADRSAARQALAGLPEALPSPAGSGASVCIHPGAGDGRRRWPTAKFAAVAAALAADGHDVAVSGAATEKRLTEAVVSEAAELLLRRAGLERGAQAAGQPRPGRLLDLAGRLSLPALVGLLAGASVVVANDSGPLHLAQAAGAATVGIFWCGNLINAGPLTRARHRVLLGWRLECPVCGVNCIYGSCPHHESFVAEVETEPVILEARSLLRDAWNQPAPGIAHLAE